MEGNTIDCDERRLKRQGLRRVARILAFACAAVVLALFGLYVSANMMMIGRPFPISQVDSLEHPVAVRGWDTEGLTLATGKRVSLPFADSLPIPSLALAAATTHGVEIDDTGKVFSLVQVHHWCGNDPVAFQLAKVNLQHFVAYIAGLERAHSSKLARFTEGRDWSKAEAFIFGPRGWRIEWFNDFVSWEQSGTSWLWQSERDDGSTQHGGPVQQRES